MEELQEYEERAKYWTVALGRRLKDTTIDEILSGDAEDPIFNQYAHAMHEFTMEMGVDPEEMSEEEYDAALDASIVYIQNELRGETA